MASELPPNEPPAPTASLLRALSAAVQFYTIVPLYRWLRPPEHDEVMAGHSLLPIIGLVIGALQISAWALISRLTTSPIASAILAALAAWIIPILLSRGLHEDGLADSADGIFGGATVERRLAIMKDSRIGAFGVIALIVDSVVFIASLAIIMAFGSRDLVPIALMAIAVIPRILALALTLPLPYLRQKDGIISASTLELEPSYSLSSVIAVVALGSLVELKDFALLIGSGAGVALALARVLKSDLGGYTGDTLGAAIKIIATTMAFVCALRVA